MPHHPFGHNAAEQELPVLKELYFRKLEHHKDVLASGVHLILGRRGAGKTALGTQLQYSRIKNDGHKPVYDVYVDVNEPKVFTDVLNRMHQSVERRQAQLTETVASLWRAALWFALLHEVIKTPGFGKFPQSSTVERLCRSRNVFGKSASGVIRTIIQALLQKLGAQATQTEKLADEIIALFGDEAFRDSRRIVSEFLRSTKRRAVIVIDTLEEYRLADPTARLCVVAMIHAACVPAQDDTRFPDAVEIKCFIPAELYGTLESDLLNIGKYEGHLHYMHWRRKDLLRMICWRYLWFLESRDREQAQARFPDHRTWNWNDYGEIRRNVWDAVFPASCDEGDTGFDSFAYVTRYTQLRPRQLIWLCNSIAQTAQLTTTYDWSSIRNAIATTTPRLAVEILNSFREVYPDAGEIVKAMNGANEYLTFGEVEERAPRTKALWPSGAYERQKFWRLLLESGLLGVVERRTDKFVETRYEYIVSDTLSPADGSEFAIHPMFHRHLSIVKQTTNSRQLPMGPEDLRD